MGGDPIPVSVPAAPHGEQGKEAETGSGSTERHPVGIAYRGPVVGDAEAISLVPDLPSEIPGMGAAESIPEDPAYSGTEDGAGRDAGHGGVLH